MQSEDFDPEIWEIETNPSKIAFAGDWHASTSWARDMIAYARSQGADTIVQAGDFGFTFQRNFLHGVRHALEQYNVNLYFVDGNHDDHNKLWYGWDYDEAGFMIPSVGNYRERLHYIPRGHRWKWWGLTFLGLGGAHSVDRPWRRPQVDWWPTETITERDIRRATEPEDERVDVMITHDLFDTALPPNTRKHTGWPDTELRASKQNRLAVQYVVERVRPRLFVHGHFHERYESTAMVNGHPIKVVGLDMEATSPERNIWVVTKDMLVPEITE
jgi:Icc-related predicted phosphoesterase